MNGISPLDAMLPHRDRLDAADAAGVDAGVRLDVASEVGVVPRLVAGRPNGHLARDLDVPCEQPHLRPPVNALVKDPEVSVLDLA